MSVWLPCKQARISLATSEKHLDQKLVQVETTLEQVVSRTRLTAWEKKNIDQIANMQYCEEQ